MGTDPPSWESPYYERIKKATCKVARKVQLILYHINYVQPIEGEKALTKHPPPFRLQNLLPSWQQIYFWKLLPRHICYGIPRQVISQIPPQPELYHIGSWLADSPLGNLFHSRINARKSHLLLYKNKLNSFLQCLKDSRLKLFALFLFVRVSRQRNLLFLARKVGVLVNFAQNMLQKVSMAVAAAVELPLREGLSIRKNQTPVIFCAQRQAELYTGG